MQQSINMQYGTEGGCPGAAETGGETSGGGNVQGQRPGEYV